jgi:hypothetical protein
MGTVPIGFKTENKAASKKINTSIVFFAKLDRMIQTKLKLKTT